MENPRTAEMWDKTKLKRASFLKSKNRHKKNYIVWTIASNKSKIETLKIETLFNIKSLSLD